MIAEDAIVRVRELLIDEGVTPVNDDAKMLRLLNDATIAILNVKPMANVVATTLELAEGSVQNLASGQLFLHDVPYVMLNDVPTSSIRRIERDQLDAFVPGWRSVSKTTTPEHYMYDEYKPKSFEVYPPNTGSGVVAVHVTEIPDPMADTDATLPLGDDYIDAYVYYVANRIVDEDSDEAGNERRADRFFTKFAETLGVKIQNRSTFSPNQKGA